MNPLLAFAALVVWALSPAHGSLWDLHKMITKATGKNALLHYSFYGCYCGLGGEGQPKDATDRCCQLHDTCYDSLWSHHCDAKVQSYLYDWTSSSPSCSVEPWQTGCHPPPKLGVTQGSPLPAGKGSWCSQLSCECDRSLALCLKRSIGSYRRRHRFYPRHGC
ncbi:LOW QUALITY PROTEIN: basic phospholipase A2 Cdr-13-like [Guaruba guarouba]